jgi:hypothetical protein
MTIPTFENRRRPGRAAQRAPRAAVFFLCLLPAAPLFALPESGLVPIPPCRLMDTRITNASYPFPYGGGPFTPWSKRTLNVAGLVGDSNPCHGIVPAGGVVSELLVKLTVVNASATGDLRAVPGPDPGGNLSASLLATPSGVPVTTTATLAVTHDLVTLQEAAATADLVIDVVGYVNNPFIAAVPIPTKHPGGPWARGGCSSPRDPSRP